MAFDRPLEADRVDDLGLLSSFVRAPVIGTIMWMFGGDAAKKREEEEQTRDMQTMIEATDDETSAFDSPDVFDKENDIDVVKHTPFGHKLTPDLTGSDLSEMSDGDCAEDLLEEHGSNNFSSLKSNRELTSSLRSAGSKRNLTRRVSFREFSDQSLDKSFNESQGSLNGLEPGSVSSISGTSSDDGRGSSMPIKSAIRRSGSLEPGTNELYATSSCIPSGMHRQSGGLIMPTRPGGVPGVQYNGKVSPQWGWYISTTPPSPEKFYTRPLGKKAKKAMQQPINELSPLPDESQNIMHISDMKMTDSGAPLREISQRNAVQHPPVFKKGMKGLSENGTMGWPSVPL